jgi:hypothetical protein
MLMFHKPKKKRKGGFVPGLKGHARADRASRGTRDDFDPDVRRASGHLGEPQGHPMDDEPQSWDADEDKAQRARSGADYVPFSVAAGRVKSPPKKRRRVEAASDDDGEHRGFVIHHVIHHATFVTPHHDESDGDEAEE